MLHPRLTPLGGTLGGSSSQWLASIGPYGTWDSLAVTMRWSQNASGMYEASWSMPLPADFSHPLLRRGTLVEIMDGPWRIGSPLILADPGKGSGFDQPWTLMATGVGREVEGENSYYALDGGGNLSSNPTTVVNAAVASGLPWLGPDASVPNFNITVPVDGPITVGSLFGITAQGSSVRWGVWGEGYVGFRADPTTPTYHVVPGVAQLGTSDDDYASQVLVRYINSTTGLATSSFSEDTRIRDRYGRRTFLVDRTSFGSMSTAAAQALADGVVALSKARLAWTNGLTVTSNEILTSGGVPADLSKVLEDAGTGCMVRLHGIWDDLLDYTGSTWIDIIVGEAKYTDGSQAIDLNPLGLAPRDLASVIESVTGIAAA